MNIRIGNYKRWACIAIALHVWDTKIWHVGRDGDMYNV